MGIQQTRGVSTSSLVRNTHPWLIRPRLTHLDSRSVVVLYGVREEIFNTAKQREALDPTGDSPEPESEDGEGGLGEDSTDIDGHMPPSVFHPDLELDGSANLGSIFLQGMLFEKELAGFSNNYGSPA
jgi:hypothetical protein